VSEVRKTQNLVILVVGLVALPVLFVGDQAARTLRRLTAVERERDTWQRPGDILRPLNLSPGKTVVDLGSGAGYFALKIAPRVAPEGRVLAVDLRRESLAFLWIRAVLGGHGNLQVILNQVDDPKLPPGLIDAVLIANTYHELTAPEPILGALFKSMRSGARLVVVDRGPRDNDHAREATAAHHEITSAAAERVINRHGFQTIARHDRFIDRPTDDDLWWLLVCRKP
jgi:predicted methyltransferase